MKWYIRIILAWLCLSVIPFPRIDFAEKFWAKYDAMILGNLGQAKYHYSPDSEFPHRVRVIFPENFKNNHSPAHIVYTPACCYLNVILACMVLALRYETWQRAVWTLLLGFLAANFANMLRITIGSTLRFQDFPLWASHDIPNYIMGFIALYLSFIGGRWRFKERKFTFTQAKY